MIKLVILGILFSTAVNAVFVARLLILGISFLTLIISVVRLVLLAKLLISDILVSILVSVSGIFF